MPLLCGRLRVEPPLGCLATFEAAPEVPPELVPVLKGGAREAEEVFGLQGPLLLLGDGAGDAEEVLGLQGPAMLPAARKMSI